MQLEQVGGTVTIGANENAAARMIFGHKPSRRCDYPCECRFCRESENAPKRPINLLAAIDVYDIPDEIEVEASEYFH